ncbi:MAG: YcgN family cysteine cluster protein, partial [Rhodomicrobium sp.]|nr:YcgN family cysteine cluster protein [Rhodomicrobium sp.]
MPRNDFAKQLKRQPGDAVPGNLSVSGDPAPFWKTKSLEEMTGTEWESLCDGCGQCCLIKLEDDDTGDIAVTRLACKLLDLGSCRCSNYDNRQAHVPDCVKLTPSDARSLRWLPKTCAYRLVSEGRGLPWWHPLVSGTSESVHEAGVSIRGAAISE